jgi:hypothetical protein
MKYTLKPEEEADITKAFTTLEMTDYNEESGFEAATKAYRTLSRKHHPDKGGDAEIFKLISGAYEKLTAYNEQVEALQLIGLTGDEFIKSSHDEILRKIQGLNNNDENKFKIETLTRLNTEMNKIRPQETMPQRNLIELFFAAIAYLFNLIVNFFSNLLNRGQGNDSQQSATQSSDALVMKTDLKQESSLSNQQAPLFTFGQKKQDSIVVTPAPGQKYVLVDIAKRFLRMFNMSTRNFFIGVDPATFTLDVSANKKSGGSTQNKEPLSLATTAVEDKSKSNKTPDDKKTILAIKKGKS